MYTVAIWHYRGGHPVPRAKSLYDGYHVAFATTLRNIGFFSLLLAWKSISLSDQTGSIGVSHRRPVKDSDQ